MSPSPRLPALAKAMLAELHTILDGEIFRNAPDLAGLLRYLVVQTLEGQGDWLTDYAVAVEGFGGIKGFETEYSGAPKRHIDRLRVALARHYARHDPVDGMCLSLIAGAYRIWVVRPEVAYPQIFYRPQMVEWPQVPQAQRIADVRVGVVG
jgi:hypothetical protein